MMFDSLRGVITGTIFYVIFFFFSSRRRHTILTCDWSSDVCSSDLRSRSSPYPGSVHMTTLTIEGGIMWTLPGYGDDLERDNPGLRQMVADMGGPVGFENVVASIQPIGVDKPELPAHWSVTFGVNDADADAAKAVDLGGTITVAPFDAPWSRLTILSNPKGPSFTPTHFVRENKDLGRPADTEGGAA